MKNLYIFICLFFSPFFASAQTVTVSGKCMTGTITLSPIGNMNGKAAYQGVGTVLGYNGITVTVYWIGANDYVWVIDFEGQPYFMNTCATSLPPATAGSSCSWVPVPGTECLGSAPLVVSGLGALPVKLSDFGAKEVDNNILLNWKTAYELNNQGFEINRSKDGANWNNIGFVNGELNSSLETNYIFIDEQPLQGNNFYRLLQYDGDGNITLSEIVKVDFSKNGSYSIGNNPGNGIYQLNIKSSNKAKILVADMSGRQLMVKQMKSGIQQLDISRFAKGTYLLRLQIGNDVFTEKLIKQ